MIKLKNSEIWYWYLRIEEWRESGLGPKKFCDAHNLDYVVFCNRRFKIYYKKYSEPELYARLLPIGVKYRESNEKLSDFATANDVDKKLLAEMNTHLSYLDIIEEMKGKHSEKSESMSFIQAPATATQRPPEAELIEKKNDIELNISSGVKVIVAPEVSSEKLIKIIELLKEL